MKNIIITGASNGIGRTIAKNLRKKYHVINIDIVENKMDGVDFYKCDFSDKGQLLKTIEKIKINIDSLYALVNNAAMFSKKILEKQTFEAWENIINTNLTAPYILSKEFASFLKESQGHIINISSTRALMSEEGTEAYSASKGGISSLTHALAISLSAEIKVNSITPGWINTNEEYLPTKNDNL